jgi:hypothetical protein
MMIDFERAFDTVSWYFIKKVRDIFNLGTLIILCVKMVQNNYVSSTIYNGNCSTPFSLERGCRQCIFVYTVLSILPITIQTMCITVYQS